MDKNDKDLLQYVEKMVNYNDHVDAARNYIKENYHVSSNYDNETNTLYVYTTNINESLNVVAAKKYVEETIGDDFIKVEYGYGK